MKSWVSRYGIAFGAVMLAAVGSFILAYPLHWGGLAFLTFPFAVLVAASYGGVGPGMVATAMSALFIAWALAEPLGSFTVAEPRARIAIALFVMTSAIQSTVLASARTTHRDLAAVNDTLRASEKKYRILFECSPMPMFLVDPSSRKIIDANAAACATYGYVHDDFVGTPIAAVFADGSDEVIARAASTSAIGGEIVRGLWHHITRGGTRLDVEGCACVVPWPLPGPLLIAAHDVSDRLQSMDALVAAAEELQRAKGVAEDANRTKDMLIRAISHELRTPLTPVLLTVSALERKEGLSESVRASMRMIRRKIEHEARLVDELLDASRMVGGDLPVNIGPVVVQRAIEGAVEACRQDAGARGIPMELTLKNTRPLVQTDELRLDTLLQTLLLHAIKSSAAERPVRVWTRNAGASRVEIGVTYEGAGMTEAEVANAFQPLASLEEPGARRVGGLGLALAIGKRMAEMSGGTISVRSEGPTSGGTFVIELPTGTPASRAASDAAENATPKRRILLVEDDADSREAASRLLASLGHEVTAVGSVSAALAAAKNTRFDVVISDLDLHQQSGLALLKALRATSAVPAIALSGLSSDDDRRASVDAGFFTHLVKPVTLAELVTAIDRATDRKEASAEATRDTAM
jgi:PAS domain S-box-containing protein